MRLLIFEDICGAGHRCDFILPPELEVDFLKEIVVEGAAMLKAVAEDFDRLRSDGIIEIEKILTHWDERGGDTPFQNHSEIHVVKVNSSRSGLKAWYESLSLCDAVLVIAPEYKGRAYEVQLQVQQASCSSLNSTPAAIRLCSDKLELSRHLQEYGINTISTYSRHDLLSECEHVVAKVRDGMGSLNVKKMLFADAETHSQSPGSYELIWQPFIAGKAYSVGCFQNQKSGCLTVLPVARQFLNDDDNMKYQGGEIPATDVNRNAVIEMATRVANSIQGLHGYFGIDFIVGQDQVPVVVEVNPRFTTSYVGYRTMTEDNLSELFFDDSIKDRIEWQNHVTFNPNGEVQTRPLTEKERECCRS